MTNVDFEFNSKDENWWQAFNEYIEDSLEHPVVYGRTYQAMKNWLDNILETNELIEHSLLRENTKISIRNFYKNSRILHKTRISHTNDPKQIQKETKRWILVGRNLHPKLVDFKNNPQEIKQSISCLSTILDQRIIKDYIDYGLYGISALNMAEKILGQNYGVKPASEMIIGYAFEESRSKGDFDDL